MANTDEDLYEDVASHAAPSPEERTPKPAAAAPETRGVVTEAEPGSPAAAKVGLDRMIADKMHPAWNASDPEHEEAWKLYEELIMLERGEGPEANRSIGTAHGWRLKPPENEADDTYIERPDAGVVADRPLQDAVMSTARTLGEGAVTAYRDFLTEAAGLRASGPPPDDITLHQQITTKWPTLAARQAVEGRLSDLYTTVDRLLANAGVPARDREAAHAQLVALEDYGVKGIEYLLGPFQQSLWDRVDAYARAAVDLAGDDYESTQEATRRANRPAPAGLTREVGTFGEARWPAPPFRP